jgi:hypothetical protein
MSIVESRVKVALTTHGYCGNCHEPKLVGDLNIPGWKHNVRICVECLNGLASSIKGGESRPTPTSETQIHSAINGN